MIDECESLNFLFRNLVEFLHFYFQFIGEKLFKKSYLYPVFMMLLFVKELDLSYAKDYLTKEELKLEK